MIKIVSKINIPKIVDIHCNKYGFTKVQTNKDTWIWEKTSNDIIIILIVCRTSGTAMYSVDFQFRLKNEISRLTFPISVVNFTNKESLRDYKINYVFSKYFEDGEDIQKNIIDKILIESMEFVVNKISTFLQLQNYFSDNPEFKPLIIRPSDWGDEFLPDNLN